MTEKKDQIETNNAVLYIRVSSKEQAEGGYSLEAQNRLLREYAKQKGFRIVHEFKDEETAKESGRRAFNEMLFFIKENPSIKHLLVEKTDRLSRNFRDIATLEDLMHKQDIHIVLVKENVEIHKDSRSNEKFMFGIRAVMAKHFIDNLSEETKKGLNQKAENGYYPGLAPFGYKNISDPKDTKRRIVGIDSKTASLVREVFTLYASGRYSYNDLAILVHKHGIRSRLGKPLHQSRIEKMLKDPFYYGYFLWGGKLYKGHHPALIDRRLFEKVRGVMQTKSKGLSGPHGVLIAYRGFLKCGSCGCSITGERKQKPSGRKYILYHCTDYYSKCQSKKQYYTEAELEMILSPIVQDLRVTDEVYELIRLGLKASAEDHEETLKGDKENCLEQKKLYERRLHKLYLDRVDGLIDNEFYRSTNTEWQSELDQINLKLSSFDRADKNYYDRGVLFLKFAKKISEYWKALKGDEYEEKMLKGELLKVILAEAKLSDGKLEYKFRKPFDSLVELLGSKEKNWGERRELNPQPQDPQLP
ncbi:MAG: hypothetical protein A3G33_11265 [Omnitrophica bacterium RIFCSPLOWO2_12_FULL_44_17]|uniref:Recombinase n=1 Tax=Candidatus Danuiimicrobium aquiferis TaxID=1801832 RepID=A0A1G1KRL5_9BACT|nr:MAG: hypothetical protein A3B72_09100 [Omnitrophica bacterium RIFCSPHIGHO2_02_FULL_45_28]OGW88347.1 MAG: hypothetical protein A3E74_10580 [Omnitrophica bacterium RIFCSPHIGHO2_12_FULL_44_12]OGW95576.1 MAG: hypothetical protein A3G33_11265 [Omnitrophica bacterium RIFCSPLOWO2_12_FULL_44_17]OGX03709.1 MAG: hypothetical protein A3J12_01225 [Omnitrophica bacterium RIFCSPLOWO2_02_FULL_44_11]